jgi:hypothetical protein
MKKVATIALILCTVAPVQAEPVGKWWSGWGMGVSEYGYKGDFDGNNSIYIACSPDIGTSVSFSINGKGPRPNSNVIVVIDDEQLELFADKNGSIPTASHVADANFRALWGMIRSGRTMKVKLSTGEVTTFPLNGSSKALNAAPCETDFAR